MRGKKEKIKKKSNKKYPMAKETAPKIFLGLDV